MFVMVFVVVVNCEHKQYCMSTDHWWNGDVSSYLVCNYVEITVCATFLHWRFPKVMKSI